MTHPRSRAWRVARGLFDLALLVAVVYVGCLLGSVALEAASRRAELRVVQSEARALYRAFQSYRQRNRGYPNSYTEPRFDLLTLDPLRRRGYYDGALPAHLVARRVDAYESPDDRSLNREFWLEMTFGRDRSIRVLIAQSDDAPLGGGIWLDGAFLYRDGKLEPL
jgi:hypothetical protein